MQQVQMSLSLEALQPQAEELEMDEATQMRGKVLVLNDTGLDQDNACLVSPGSFSIPPCLHSVAAQIQPRPRHVTKCSAASTVLSAARSYVTFIAQLDSVHVASC